MMIKSMTGYGSGQGGGYVVEMRSVNHKFLDISPKLPRSLVALEGEIRKALSERFSRGRIDVFVSMELQGRPRRVFSLDTDAAGQYVGLLNELKEKFGLSGELDLTTMAGFRDILVEEEQTQDMGEAWAALAGPVESCIASLSDMREREGGVLAVDIAARAGAISSRLDKVEARAPMVVKEYAERLRERVTKLAQGVELDRDRMEQELAIMADRSDVTEEIVRGRSHLELLGRLLDSDEPVGRKMDFLIQEINRELNTIGSKTSDRDIAHLVVEMKAELEKVREQAQNIE